MNHFSFKLPTTIEDHKFLVNLHNDPLVLKNITNPKPITLADHQDWWMHIVANQHIQQRFMFLIDSVPAGFVKFYDIDQANKNCVLGADLHKDFRGKGFAKFMWKMMLEHCFSEEKLNLHRVSLTTASFNTVAQRVYLNLGFIEEGRKIHSLFRDNTFYDEICMYLLKEKWENESRTNA